MMVLKRPKLPLKNFVIKDADVIGFGLALVGDGQAWLDSVSIKLIDE